MGTPHSAFSALTRRQSAVAGSPERMSEEGGGELVGLFLGLGDTSRVLVHHEVGELARVEPPGEGPPSNLATCDSAARARFRTRSGRRPAGRRGPPPALQPNAPKPAVVLGRHLGLDPIASHSSCTGMFSSASEHVVPPQLPPAAHSLNPGVARGP